MTLRDEVLKDSRSNMGVSYAYYDEGAFRNELKGWDAGNMEIAPESLRVINNVLPRKDRIRKVELGNYYGDKKIILLGLYLMKDCYIHFNHTIKRLLQIK